MTIFYLFSVWLHVLAAMVWIGGMAFFALVVVPAVRLEPFRANAPALIHWSGLRFRWIGWSCLALLLATGVVNLSYRGLGWQELWGGKLWQSSPGSVLGLKLFLFIIVLMLSLLHDFFIGPRATAAGRTDPASPQAMRAAHYARWIGRLNLLLGVIAVALGVLLVRGSPW